MYDAQCIKFYILHIVYYILDTILYICISFTLHTGYYILCIVYVYYIRHAEYYILCIIQHMLCAIYIYIHIYIYITPVLELRAAPH